MGKYGQFKYSQDLYGTGARVVIVEDDVSDRILWRTLKVDNVLTQQVDTAEFEIMQADSTSQRPLAGQEVSIYDGIDKIFGGSIVEVEDTVESRSVFTYRVRCVDHTKTLDRKLVVKQFEDKTVNEIIIAIKTDFLEPDFTIDGVDAPVLVKFISFNYEPPSQAFKQLAELIGYDWYVDPDKDIKFFSKEANNAPYNIDDTSGNLIWQTLTLMKDTKQLRNTIIVRGGEFLGDPFTEEKEADGEQTVFPLAYKYKEPSVEVSGSPKTVGIDNIDDPTAFDCLFNFQEKIIRFRDNNKPIAGQIFKFTGRPYLPVIVQTRDYSAITETAAREGGSGVYEHRIVDKAIKSREGARDRARGELIRWARELTEASFITRRKGLRAGQKISVISSIRNISEDFIINRVTTTTRTPNNFQYEISLITTKTYGMMDFMLKLLEKEAKQIEINPDEILDKIESALEGITVQEIIQRQVATDKQEAIVATDVLASTLFTPPFKWADGVFLPEKLRWNLGQWN